jgi:hypothetical protein
MPRTIKLVFVLLALLSIGAVVICLSTFFYRVDKSFNPPPPGWKSFINLNYGYGINYPDFWTVTAGDDGIYSGPFQVFSNNKALTGEGFLAHPEDIELKLTYEDMDEGYKSLFAKPDGFNQPVRYTKTSRGDLYPQAIWQDLRHLTISGLRTITFDDNPTQELKTYQPDLFDHEKYSTKYIIQGQNSSDWTLSIIYTSKQLQDQSRNLLDQVAKSFTYQPPPLKLFYQLTLFPTGLDPGAVVKIYHDRNDYYSNVVQPVWQSELKSDLPVRAKLLRGRYFIQVEMNGRSRYVPEEDIFLNRDLNIRLRSYGHI